MVFLMFWHHKFDRYLIEVSTNGRSFELLIFDSETNKPVSAPLEFRKKFWRDNKILLKIAEEFKELGITNINIKHIGIDIEESYNKYLESLEVDLLKEKFSEHSASKIERGVIDKSKIFQKPTFLKIISPSIGFLRFCYTMFTIEQINENVIQNIPCMIFSDGNVLPLTSEDMAEQNIYPLFIPTMTKNRWSLESIESFTKNPKIEMSYFNELCNKIAGIFDSYIEFVDGKIVSRFLACWVIGTYLQPFFKSYPYVFLNGIKASGKTKTLDVAQQLAFNSVNSTNMSTSSLFRIIQSLSATVLIDESENLKDKDRSEAFRELLLSGYKKGTQTFRVEEAKINDVKTYVVKEFNLFSPKMIANITGMEDILESRCISINMKPAKDQAIANREITEEDEVWQKTRDDLYLFFMTGSMAVRMEYECIENDGFFKNREWELWKPILCIARTFGCYDDILKYAKKSVIHKRENEVETNEYLIMDILVDMVQEDGFYSFRCIMEDMAESFGFIEKIYDKDGKQIIKGHIPGWLNGRYIGNVLKRFGWHNRRRLGKGYEINLKRSEIIEQAIRMNIKISPKLFIIDLLQNNIEMTQQEIINKKGNYEEEEIIKGIDDLKTEGRIFEPYPSRCRLV